MNREAQMADRVAQSTIAGTVEPPPKTTEEVFRWAEAIMAAGRIPRLRKHVTDIEERRERAVHPQPSRFDLPDAKGNVIEEVDWDKIKKYDRGIAKVNKDLAEAYSDVKKSPGVKVRNKKWKRVSRKFSINTSGWRYKARLDKADPERVSLADDELGVITIELVDGGIKGNARGYWKRNSATIRISSSGDGKWNEYLRSTIKHELIHWVMDYLNVALNTEDFGLPSKRVRDPLITQWTDGNDARLLNNRGISTDDFHSLHDIEFYTKLADAIRLAEAEMPEGRKDRDRYFREFIGLDDDVFLRSHDFFRTLKKHSLGKWKKAVKEFAKAVM